MSDPSPRSTAGRPTKIAALLATAGALVYLWLSWCAFPASNWNELRLAPTFALLHGETIYPPANGGPLSTWIYGPVGLLVNLPATLASSAAGAIRVAGVINALTLVAPLAVIFFASSDLRARGRATRWLALSLAVLLLPATSLQFQVPDHAAIALGLLSCFCLAHSERPSRAHLIVAAALCALAAWSKQTAVFLAPAQAVWLLARGERSLVARYVFWVLLFGLSLLIASVLAFGFSGLWLNLVAIPARLPWGDIPDKLARRWPQLAVQLLLPAVLLVLLRRRGLWPARDSEAGRFLGIALCVAVVFVPVGLASFFKIGGDLNMLHWWFYLVPAIGLAWFARPCSSPLAQFSLVGLVLLVRVPDFRALPLTPNPAPLDLAEELARANHGAIWFPYNPLVTFFSDGKFYHVEDGIATRNLAGLGLRESGFRRHLPAQLGAIVYPANQTDCFALQLLPEFNRRTIVGDWAVYRRKDAP